MEAPEQVKPFAQFLQELDHGNSHSELSDALNELTQAVALLGKTGTLTYTVKMKPAGRSGGRTVMITDDIKLRLPTGERADTIWFVDRNGNVVRNDPDQLQLPSLKEVPQPRKVDVETGEIAR